MPPKKPEPDNKTGPILAPVEQKGGVAQMFDNYVPTPASERKLPVREGMEDVFRKLQLSFFRAEQMYQLTGGPESKYYRAVQKKTTLDFLGADDEHRELTFADVFVGEDDPGYPFDADGLIGHGGYVRVQDRQCRESYLAARPASANEAEQRLRAKTSSQWKLNPDDQKLVNMDVRDPKTGEQLLAGQTFNPADATPKMMTSASLAQGSWGQIGSPGMQPK